MSGVMTDVRRQRLFETLAFIDDFKLLHGYMPTVQEIAAGLGLCRSGAFYRIEALQRMGLLERPRLKGRALVRCGPTLGFLTKEDYKQ